MDNHPPLFRKVAIVGMGLIGSSVGMAIKKHGVAREVIGVSRQQASLSQSLKNHAVDKTSHDVKRSVADADLIVLSTPVKTIIQLFSLIGPSLKRGAIVTDVGSTKAAIVDGAHKHLPAHVSFVGSHPLAGSEKKGAAFGSAELFQNTSCILTPTEKTNRGALGRIESFWSRLGARVKVLAPAEHDEILGYISHLPHLLAYGLMETIPSNHLSYAPQGLRDTTRIAASDPEMWKDICLTNQIGILKSLDELVKVLSSFRRAIVLKDENNLLEHFKKSKHKRDALDKG